jgi:hypothetical protein
MFVLLSNSFKDLAMLELTLWIKVGGGSKLFGALAVFVI